LLGKTRGTPDKTRLCPSCRSEISVLATKCRYCGEEVGRPRDEARQFSISQLGGEHTNQYAPSGNVLEALESFRAEVLAEGAASEQRPQKKRRLLGRKAVAKEECHDSDGADSTSSSPTFPELDERSQALASLSIPRTPRRATPARTPPWRKSAYVFGAFVSAVVILFFGVTKGGAMIRDYLAKRNAVEQVRYLNLAPEILERNGDLIEALEATLLATKHNPSAENQRITGEVRKKIADKIDGLLNAYPWEKKHLDEASALASQAARVDPTEAMIAKKSEVDKEVFAYKMSCVEIKLTPERKAQFRLYDPEAPVKRTWLKENESLRGRFVVRHVRSDRVIVDDTRRMSPHRLPRRIAFLLHGDVRPAH